MDVLEKAKELGMMIGASKEMTDFKKFELQMLQDERAKTLLNDYKLLLRMFSATGRL